MYDGWKIVEKKRVNVPASTFVLSIFDEGDPHIIDDETWTYYEVSIPDDGERRLPIAFHDVSGTLTVTGFRSPESGAFAGGTLALERAVPGGFIASYDLGSGNTRTVGRAIARSVGEKRQGIWPYDSVPEESSLGQRLSGAIKDAWRGAI